MYYIIRNYAYNAYQKLKKNNVKKNSWLWVVCREMQGEMESIHTQRYRNYSKK